MAELYTRLNIKHKRSYSITAVKLQMMCTQTASIMMPGPCESEGSADISHTFKLISLWAIGLFSLWNVHIGELLFAAYLFWIIDCIISLNILCFKCYTLALLTTNENAQSITMASMHILFVQLSQPGYISVAHMTDVSKLKDNSQQLVKARPNNV